MLGTAPFITRVASWLLNPHASVSRERLSVAIKGKITLVTGASSGVGEATACLLAAAGAEVHLVSCSAAELERVAAIVRAAGGIAEVHPADLSDTDVVADLANRLLESRGRVDILVSNAGKSIRRSVAFSYDRFHDFERTIGINYLGPVQLVLALLPGMRKRREGTILNVSTFGVRMPSSPRWGAYQASKSAFDTWFRSMGIEVRSDGVVTSTVYLPLVYTKMSAPTPSLRGLPGMTAEQAAQAIASAITKRKRVIAPWWLLPAELVTTLFRRPVEWIQGLSFRHSQDSPGAMGIQAPQPKTPGLRQAFRTAGLLPLPPAQLARMARALLVQGGRPCSLAQAAARLAPDRPAVIDEAGIVTYRELLDRSGRLARTLKEKCGAEPGQAVGVLARNHRCFVEALLAASTGGADAVLLNTEFPGPQLAQVLDRSRLVAIVHDTEFAEPLACSGFSGQRVAIDGDRFTLAGQDACADEPLGIRRRGGKIVLLTSGTTGVPKGAARSSQFRSQSGALRTLLTRVPFRAGGVILIAPPLFHGMGFVYLNMAFFLGATVVVRRKFDPQSLLTDAENHGANVIIAVPAMLQRMLEIQESPALPNLKAVLVSGAPLGADLGNRFQQAFGPVLYNLYGSSEVGFGAIATPSDLLAAPGTVGYPPADTTIRILGRENQPLAAGKTGRVFVKNGLAFTGYIGGGMKEVIDGHLETGDLGHLDDAGRLFIDGRADDMILSGGENVFPGEVEEVLDAHPHVLEVAVIGTPDVEFGQRLRAFVVLRPGSQCGIEELRNYLKERVARFKVPRDFVILPALPRNSMGKVQKRDLATLEKV